MRVSPRWRGRAPSCPHWGSRDAPPLGRRAGSAQPRRRQRSPPPDWRAPPATRPASPPFKFQPVGRNVNSTQCITPVRVQVQHSQSSGEKIRTDNWHWSGVTRACNLGSCPRGHQSNGKTDSQQAELCWAADLGEGERRRSRSGRSLKRLAVASMTSAYLGDPATISVLPLVSKST